MRPCCSQNGFVLLTVLVVAAIGLLFGAGALLLFRYQCQLRIDRQHEFEKVYAVRSALNYVRTYTDEIDEDVGLPFTYRTYSGRDLNLLVKPVERIFPDTKKGHFCMEEAGAFGGDVKTTTGGYNTEYDYEYGVIGTTNALISIVETSGERGLAFTDSMATNGVTWWVNIGMRETEGWLKSEYGLRYYFHPRNYVGENDNTSRDVMRFCIIRNTNHNDKVECKYGWPLSPNEKALVFQIKPGESTPEGGDRFDAVMSFAEYVCNEDGSVVTNAYPSWSERIPSYFPMGLQVAKDRVTMFYINDSDVSEPASRGYRFSQTMILSPLTYEYFRKVCKFDDNGNVLEAPELRVVIEVDAVSSKRNGGMMTADEYDMVTKLRVTPAWQYDVYLEHPEGVINLATVAQKIGTHEYDFDYPDYSLLTYDTHGTENKGFRKDERDAERKRNGQ